MKLAVFDAKKARTGDVDLPVQFSEPVRSDLIKRAVHALQAGQRQPYGSDPRAGKRSSSKVSRRRRNYRGSYGQGISRVPRKVLNRRGTRMYFVGAFAPGTVGGRRAHPPKAEKVWEEKINDRERRKAIRSALAATVARELVTKRGHLVPEAYPFALDDSFERLAKTKEVKAALRALGFEQEMARASVVNIKAGKASMRGRKRKKPVSLLLVTSSRDAKLALAAANLPGLTIVPVDVLNAELLAPGTHAGRATLFTNGALARIANEGLYTDHVVSPVAATAKATPVKAEKKSAANATKERAAKAVPAVKLKAASAPKPKTVKGESQ